MFINFPKNLPERNHHYKHVSNLTQDIMRYNPALLFRTVHSATVCMRVTTTSLILKTSLCLYVVKNLLQIVVLKPTLQTVDIDTQTQNITLTVTSR